MDFSLREWHIIMNMLMDLCITLYLLYFATKACLVFGGQNRNV